MQSTLIRAQVRGILNVYLVETVRILVQENDSNELGYEKVCFCLRLSK